jgi:hypothetical protein
MRRYIQALSLGMLVLLGLLAGCSNKESTPAADNANEAGAASIARKAGPVAETADQAVLQVAEGLADGQPQVVWHALPASYQQDVTALIHDFAGAMDAELWNRSFGVVQKITLVLSEKRELILDHPMLQSKVKDREEASKAWDEFVGILDVVVNSDLSDLDRMKQFDVEQFLSGTGVDVAHRFKGIEAFAPTDAVTGSFFGPSGAEATLISSEGDHAVVRYQVSGQPATEEDFLRVEGKWIPAQMANEWESTIASAREQLAGFSGEEMQAKKQATLMQLAMIDGALDQLLATETPEQFNAAVGGLMGMAMGAVMAQAQNMPSFDSPAPAPQPQTMSYTQPQEQPQVQYEPQVEPTPSTTAEALPLDSIEDYIGRSVRVTERNGSNTDGFLIEVTDSLVIIEKRIGESSMEIEVSRTQIDTVHPIAQ